jgi:hypothetical protein
VGICPRRPLIFFLPSHIPCDTASHGRTPQPVPPQLFIFGPRILYGRKKKMPHAPQIHLWFRTYFAKSDGKNADLVKTFSFSPKDKK